ncbi:hypothetical protein Ga0061079_105191 [Apibacter mensalis]|uniref:Uncharacterized protein n=1 Tax=Apibacter mensalis TaxID=1586267 RepID=A0A0X3APE4_9FLAO|nr:hypothetical protein [Apibacter mensalis]CVK16231.1 hypothetical protein Ga0061079_105191 [Apibacter mensalis]
MNRFYFIIYLLLINCVINAQVGIGTETPDSNTMLDVVSPNNNKGILIPRLTEAQRDEIDKANAKDGLLIYNTTENCFNYWNKIEDVWSSLCGRPGKAVFSMECNTLKINGTYLNKTAVTSDNKLLLTVDVIKPGSYNINATSSPDNKYYFTKSGDFLSTGTYTIEVPCYGTPENFTPSGQPGDEFTLLMNGVAVSAPCSTFNVEVQDSSVKPVFTMDCSSTTVRGIYQNDIPLTNSNYIEVTIRFDASFNGAPLYLYTDTVEGISFKSDKLTLDSQGQTSGWVTQTVKLLGEGAPISYSPKKMTIHSNSVSSTATCEATVLVGYDYMKLYTTGVGVYNALGNGNLAAMIKNEDNFGLQPYSIVKFRGWTKDSKHLGDSPGSNIVKNELLGSNPPDIVITGQTGNLDAEAAKYYAEYLKKGGVMLVFMEDNDRIKRFLTGLYPDGGIKTRYVTGVGAGGAVYKLKDINNPIVNGPFGDIRGEFWGEDASTTTGIVSGLPLSSDIEVLSTAPNGDVTAFKHKKYNLVLVCDGGFNSSGASNGVLPGNAAGNIYYPMFLGSVTIGGHTYPLYPIPKPAYGNDMVGLNQYSVYNSVFTANAVAWAIQAAQTNGINPHINK